MKARGNEIYSCSRVREFSFTLYEIFDANFSFFILHAWIFNRAIRSQNTIAYYIASSQVHLDTAS